MPQEADPPFVYIAALMRTGSTLLSEALTKLPFSFIFREPHIGKNDFQTRPGDVALLREHGVDVERMLTWRRRVAFLQRRLRWLGYRQDYMVRVLQNIVRPKLAKGVFQLGVKEVRNRGWQQYHRCFPTMRVIITGRDPRDIYLSTLYHWRAGQMPRRKAIGPDLIAAELQAEFRLQMAMHETVDSFLVRYEDLCRDPEIVEEVKLFVHSPIPGLGEIGQFNRRHPERVHEAEMHGSVITDKRVARWRREKDPRVRREAQMVLEMMPEYALFWGYKS